MTEEEEGRQRHVRDMDGEAGMESERELMDVCSLNNPGEPFFHVLHKRAVIALHGTSDLQMAELVGDTLGSGHQPSEIVNKPTPHQIHCAKKGLEGQLTSPVYFCPSQKKLRWLLTVPKQLDRALGLGGGARPHIVSIPLFGGCDCATVLVNRATKDGAGPRALGLASLCEMKEGGEFEERVLRQVREASLRDGARVSQMSIDNMFFLKIPRNAGSSPCGLLASGDCKSVIKIYSCEKNVDELPETDGLATLFFGLGTQTAALSIYGLSWFCRKGRATRRHEGHGGGSSRSPKTPSCEAKISPLVRVRKPTFRGRGPALSSEGPVKHTSVLLSHLITVHNVDLRNAGLHEAAVALSKTTSHFGDFAKVLDNVVAVHKCCVMSINLRLPRRSPQANRSSESLAEDRVGRPGGPERARLRWSTGGAQERKRQRIESSLGFGQHNIVTRVPRDDDARGIVDDEDQGETRERSRFDHHDIGLRSAIPTIAAEGNAVRKAIIEHGEATSRVAAALERLCEVVAQGLASGRSSGLHPGDEEVSVVDDTPVSKRAGRPRTPPRRGSGGDQIDLTTSPALGAGWGASEDPSSPATPSRHRAFESHSSPASSTPVELPQNPAGEGGSGLSSQGRVTSELEHLSNVVDSGDIVEPFTDSSNDSFDPLFFDSDSQIEGHFLGDSPPLPRFLK